MSIDVMWVILIVFAIAGAGLWYTSGPSVEEQNGVYLTVDQRDDGNPWALIGAD